MSLRVGIVGLPNVGKSTLFNALLKKRVALSANYPFATIEPNVGVVAVPDERLDKLAELVKNEEKMVQLPPIVPAIVEFVDIAGLVKGAATGAGLGNQFLSHIREVDAIIHVLRDFSDSNIIREGSIAPDEDKLIVETELGLADLETLEKLLKDKALEPEKKEILNKIKEDLDAGRNPGIYPDLPLLSTKPVLLVFNVSEEEYKQKVTGQKQNEMVISARLEEELADLSEQERVEYLKELGIEQTGLERLIKKAYSLLGLISFLTAGKKEVRAWTIQKGTKALQAAGVIHTDFEKKFIRAQIVSYEKLIEAGSLAAAKQKGWVRTEGKDYEMRDGDVVEFLIGS
ncbi:redox-regulated ATPase YchF [Candidatus Daviesbacteria bacterium]|nr:redox-regulated ATPase YchF [Candidatus Daviesbacteria bacterium]